MEFALIGSDSGNGMAVVVDWVEFMEKMAFAGDF
jgi:hypothetical protein